MTKLGADPTNPFRHLALEGREATAHHRNTKAHLHDSLDVSDWVTRCLRNCIDEFTARIQSGLAILASVGSTAPFIGLFGTVWGIYHALLAIGTSGQSTIDKVAGPIGEALIMTALGLAVLASVGSTAPFIGLFGTVWGIYHALIAIGTSGQSTIDKVAGPIGEALIMTALGLAVAIPAVLGYNALVRGNKSILIRLNSFAHDLHAYFVTGARVSSSTAAANVHPLKKGA